jgi:membrane-associated phospholipid phosphatase
MILTILNVVENWWQELLKADQQLFLLLNNKLHHPLLDAIYPWWREANTWVPLYLFLIVFSILNFGKKAYPWILFSIVTLVLTDQLSSHVIKPFFERPRPCRDPFIMQQIRLLLNGCSGGFSFTSSHATNHFGFAIYVFITLGKIIGKWKWLFIFWAASIAYGQVYVGVHYPLDIFCGGLVGACVGYITANFYWRRIGSLANESKPQMIVND